MIWLVVIWCGWVVIRLIADFDDFCVCFNVDFVDFGLVVCVVGVLAVLLVFGWCVV